ncbi:MAG: hypothetical protein HOC27_04155 [Phycisphaerae bacterium]|jgi:hypothetical protein|nr:hypothetical protein [Phycisphaerae bacterium]
MKKTISIFFVAILSSSSVALAQSPPPNDECSDATTSYVGANSFDSTDATPSWQQDPDDSQCAGTYLDWNYSPDIWFKFTPSTNGDYSFSTCDASSYDTSIVLYSADPFYECYLLTQKACNGDAVTGTGCQPYHSEIEYTLTANVNYYIRIGSFTGCCTGEGTLTVTELNGGSNVWYVNANNTNPGNGTSWTSAFLDLQDALDVASSGDQIWIAEGIYTPTDLDGTTDKRKASYRLSSGVEIYGGFLGNETDISERMPNSYRVFLTGDINGNDDSGGDNSENAYHVVTIDNLSGNPLLLDGVRIVKGNANGGSNELTGGGVLVTNYVPGSNANPRIRGCYFVGNSADYGGAIGMDTENCQLTLSHCIISGNNSVYRGGGIYSSGVTVVDNCLLVGNNSGNGGAIFAEYMLYLYSNTVVQNSADFVGGLLIGQNSTAAATNNIFWGNEDVNGNNSQIYYHNSAEVMSHYNCIQNSSNSGNGNISTYPIFMDEFGSDGEPGTGDEDFRLLQQSPCIDAGNSDYAYSSLDLDFSDRLLDDPYTVDTGNNSNGGPVVDMGAYEHVPDSNGVYIWTANNSTWFSDSENWLPTGTPDSQSITLFNWSDPNVTFGQATSIQNMIITEGDVIFDLMDNSLYLYDQQKSLRIGSPYNDASATFKGIGMVESNAQIKLLGGDLTIKDNVDLISYNGMWIGDGSTFNLNGTYYGEVQNESGKLHPGGREIGRMYISGDLTQQENGSSHKPPIGSLNFDIQGTNSSSDYDELVVSGIADLSCSINLSFDGNYSPIEGDSFNLITAGFATGEATTVCSNGLPSNLSIRWTTPRGLRGTGDEVIVETTGPILFDAGSTHPLTFEPNEIVAADFDGINGTDLAMTVSDPSFGFGNVIILLNNGMSQGVWQGFAQQPAIPVGIEPLDIALIDASNDGTANDLVVANYYSDSISVLTNNGSGVFTTIEVPTDVAPKYISIANFVKEEPDDLTLDDIAVACDSGLMSIVQNTTAYVNTAFTHLSSKGIPYPDDILPGDVNNDKDFDHVILSGGSNVLRVIDGDGTGIYDALTHAVDNPLPSGSGAVEFAFADLDSDGFDDAITVNETDGSISIFYGNGEILGNASTVAVGSSPSDIVVADFDNDGDDDFVLSVIDSDTSNRVLTIIRNDTVSTVVLSAGDSTGDGSEPLMVQHGDFNNDGLLDIISLVNTTPIAKTRSPAISLFLNTTAVVVDCPEDVDGDGTVAVGDILALIAAWGSNDAAADVNNDGLVDVSDLLALVGAWGPC